VNDLDLGIEGLSGRNLKSDRVNNTEIGESKVPRRIYQDMVRGVNISIGLNPGNRQSFALVLGC
jgi:hypothetical protein